MSAGTFILSMIRVLLAVGAAGVAGRRIATGLGYGTDALGYLASAVVGVSLVLVWAEALGLAGALRSGPLIAGLIVAVGLAWRWSRRRPTAATADPHAKHPTRIRLLAAGAVAIVLTQWLLATANALGGGMYNFDTLWYHMPFAAGFALSGSVTGIHFTQADPWVAYYPANSELVHAIGIVLVHGDLLSPLINLGWLAILLLAAWCFGRPWGREPETLVAGCLLAGLPVLASTQPGEAFNDAAGLAMLVAAVALLVNDRGTLVPAGLALGFALAVKFTFLVPVLIIVLGVVVGRRRQALTLGLCLLATGGWWYLRNLVRVGTPLGTRLHLGPITLPGPRSPLASSEQQTVFSQVRHLSLWGSRFLPGLTHAFGVLWPVLLLGALAAVVGALRRPNPPAVKAIAVAAAASGLAYVVLPTGATGIGTSTALFEVNLRYTTPALGLALLLAAAAVARGSRIAPWAAPAAVLALALAQAEPALWPQSWGRHLAFAAIALIVVGAGLATWRCRGAIRGGRASIALTAGILGIFGAGYVVEHHYLQRRYRTGVKGDPTMTALYSWAQTIAHARIALYGTLEQYPLGGALVTNRVDYLGAPTSDGGYAPISDCATWRRSVDADHAQYVVMTPGPTGTAPLSWTASDPAAHEVLAAGPAAAVFALSAPLNPRGC